MAERPIIVNVDANLDGLKDGMDQAGRELKRFEGEATEAGAQAGTSAGEALGDGMSQGVQSRQEQIASDIRDMVGINTMADFAQMAQQAAQVYMDAFVAGLQAQKERIKTVRDEIFGILQEGKTPTAEDELTARVKALGGGDYAAGLLYVQQNGLTAEQILAATPDQGGLGGQLGAAAADVGGGAFPLGIAGFFPAIGALAFAVGRVAETSGAATQGMLAQAAQGSREALLAQQTSNALLQQIANNTATGSTAGAAGPIPALPSPSAAIPSSLFGVNGSTQVPVIG